MCNFKYIFNVIYKYNQKINKIIKKKKQKKNKFYY